MISEQTINHRQILEHLYHSFNGKMITEALAVIHSDATWANGMEGGLLFGHDQIRSYWERQWSYIDWHVKFVNAYITDEGLAIIDIHQIIRDLSGNIISIKDIQHIMQFEDGLIKSMRIR